LISDVSIFKSGGFEICKKIKSNINTCHILLILFLEKYSIEQIIEAYELGVDDYITKPLNKNLLSAKINRLVQSRLMIKEKYREQNFIMDLEKISISKDEHFVKVVKKILKDNLSDPDLNVTSLSEKLNISTTQLYRNIKKSTGNTPVEFIRRVRLQSAFKMLSQGNNSVTEVCYNSGFNNVSYFIKCFKNRFGVTPAHFRHKARSEFHEGLIF
jgi:YesN/AraC family two-component response regulator